MSDDEGIPLDIRRELMACATAHGSISYQWLCDIYRRGAAPSRADYWRCRACGCLWRDNHDGTVSLGSVKQTSCAECEMKPTPDACDALQLLVRSGAADGSAR